MAAFVFIAYAVHEGIRRGADEKCGTAMVVFGAEVCSFFMVREKHALYRTHAWYGMYAGVTVTAFFLAMIRPIAEDVRRVFIIYHGCLLCCGLFVDTLWLVSDTPLPGELAMDKSGV